MIDHDSADTALDPEARCPRHGNLYDHDELCQACEHEFAIHELQQLTPEQAQAAIWAALQLMLDKVRAREAEQDEITGAALAARFEKRGA